MGKKALRYGVVFGLATAMAFAQTSSFGQVATGVANEMILIARWLGVVVCIVAGIGLAVGEHHMGGKIFGLVIGLVFALFAQPIVTWIQGL